MSATRAQRGEKALAPVGRALPGDGAGVVGSHRPCELALTLVHSLSCTLWWMWVVSIRAVAAPVPGFGSVLESFLSPDGPTRNAAEATLMRMRTEAPDALASSLSHVRAALTLLGAVWRPMQCLSRAHAPCVGRVTKLRPAPQHPHAVPLCYELTGGIMVQDCTVNTAVAPRTLSCAGNTLAGVVGRGGGSSREGGGRGEGGSETGTVWATGPVCCGSF